MTMTIKKCEKCDGNTQPVVSRTNPRASEFYCKKCHKSYRMDIGEAHEWIATLNAQNTQ